MKSLRNKVILSSAVLLFALIATIGSTYAWFTVSNEVEVQSMALNVQSSDSLLIKMYDPDDPTGAASDINNAASYFTTLTTAQIKAQYAYNGVLDDGDGAWTLYPVSAIQAGYLMVDGNTAALTTLDTPLTDFTRVLEPITLGTDVNTGVTGKVIELKFWVLSQGDTAKNLYLSDLVVTASNAITVRDEVINAVRISCSTATGDALIYGEEIDYDFAYLTGRPGFDSDVTAGTQAGGFNALSELTVNGEKTTILADTSHGTVNDSGDYFAVLESNTPTIIVVTIWVEGWDAEASNNIIAADFNITFKFKI